MIKTIKEVYCDICGKKKTQEINVTQSYPVRIENLNLIIYYGGGRKCSDICKECNDKLIKCLRELNCKGV